LICKPSKLAGIETLNDHFFRAAVAKGAMRLECKDLLAKGAEAEGVKAVIEVKKMPTTDSDEKMLMPYQK